jgi:hypothetical protein
LLHYESIQRRTTARQLGMPWMPNPRIKIIQRLSVQD